MIRPLIMLLSFGLLAASVQADPPAPARGDGGKKDKGQAVNPIDPPKADAGKSGGQPARPQSGEQPTGPAGGGQPAGPPSGGQPARPPANDPKNPPAAGTGAAAAQGPVPATSGDKDVDALLDRLEAKGEAVRGLATRLKYKYVTVDPVESAQVKTGDLLFAKPSAGDLNAMFLIHFDTMVADGVKTKNEETIVFDGNWLIERNDKAKTIIRREVVRKGQRVNPFQIGEGPFPMPFGQKRADMLRHFKISREAFAVGDPVGSTHLHCVPLPHSRLASRYTRVEMYVDPKLDLPVRIVSERLSDGNRIEVDFTDVDTRAAPAGSRFKVEEPADFDKRIEPITDEAAGPNDEPPPRDGK